MPVVTGRKAWLGGVVLRGHIAGWARHPWGHCPHLSGVGGVHSPEVKFDEGVCATNGHGSRPRQMGTEPRKYGVRSVFDTLVVHTVNDGCWRATATHTRSTSPGKQPQGRGPNEIGGSPLKRWGMWFNSTVHGAPYRLQWGTPTPLMWKGGSPPIGAAWLSSVRAVRRGLGWPNERNPRGAGLVEGWGVQPRLRWPLPRFPDLPPLVGRGVVEVKSIWPISAGPHTCHKAPPNGPLRRRPSRPPTGGPVRTACCKSHARS